MAVSTSISDARLGLTSSEWQIVVHQQQIALQGSHNGSISRGRGMGRTSNSSSRAVSAASTQGRLLLDPDSIQALCYQLDHLLRDVRRRIDYVSSIVFLLSLIGICIFYKLPAPFTVPLAVYPRR